MNIEIESNGHKVTIDAPHVRTPEEAEHVTALAVKAMRDAQGDKPATPLPFGFSVWADTERDTSGEVAEDARA